MGDDDTQKPATAPLVKRTTGPIPVSKLNTKRAARKRLFFILLGLGLFFGVHLSPPWGSAIDPQGVAFELTRSGKAALGLFFLAAVWWVTEVIPIGITSIAIGALQALLEIRPVRVSFTDFMDPSVWFIFGSLFIGMAVHPH